MESQSSIFSPSLCLWVNARRVSQYSQDQFIGKFVDVTICLWCVLEKGTILVKQQVAGTSAYKKRVSSAM
uniref:Uncharacterized protein n=1 Tax=Rhizophora mucronata TaxID=61149 RepID=A0A2P2MXF5_RHIMU